jgi:hypothetical protein
MDNYKETTPISKEFDFSKVPSWYTLCTNNDCPLKADCLRYLAGQNTPENVEVAKCVMPKTLKDSECQWFDRIKTSVWAAGFSHLYDNVMKKDYTKMRKTITNYLHGTKIYYEYMRGERALSQEEQQWIRDYVKHMGYDWEVEFDSYFEEYVYNHKEKAND